MRSERFFTKLEQTHARNFLKETVEHVLLANPKPCVKHIPNTCLVKTHKIQKYLVAQEHLC
jgi:hypothetical protein